MSTNILADGYVCNDPKQLFIDYFKVFLQKRYIKKDIDVKNVYVNLKNTFCSFDINNKNLFYDNFYLKFIAGRYIVNPLNNENVFFTQNVDEQKHRNNECDESKSNTMIRNLLSAFEDTQLEKFDSTKINFKELATNMGFTSNNTTISQASIKEFNKFINSASTNATPPNATSPNSSTNSSNNATSSNNLLKISKDFINKFTITTESCKNIDFDGLKNKYLYKYNDNSKQYYLINNINTNTNTNNNLCINKTENTTENTIIFILNNLGRLSKVYYKGTIYLATPSTSTTITEDEKPIRLEINAIIKEIEAYTASGGAKKNNKKKTKDTIVYKGKSRCVYTGPRGGKYIKYNNKYMSCKNV